MGSMPAEKISMFDFMIIEGLSHVTDDCTRIVFGMFS
jgi:hypothetical protein